MFRALVTPFVTALCLLVSSSLHAQESRPERPYRGLFGGGDVDVQQGLSVSGSLGGGYDTDLSQDAQSATQLSIPGTQLAQSGALGQFSGSLSYVLSGESASLSASAGSTGRYYPSGGEQRILRRDSLGLQGSTRLGAGLSVSASASYAPFRVSDLYPSGVAAGPGEASDFFDFGASAEHYLAYSGGISGEWQMSRRASFSANYRYGGSVMSENIPRPRSHQGGGGMQYNLGRGLDFNLGYRHTQARYAASEAYVTHGINAGVNFRRALSFSRRTTLSFRTGTMAADDPSTGEGLRFHAVGDVALNHEIGRTWKAALTYDRNLRFTENWTTPVFSDAVGISLEGLVNRRMAFHSRGGASSGRLSAGSGGGFDAYFADAGLTFALGRHAAIGTSYRYHNHEFANAFSGVPGIPSSLERHSVQAYLSVWAPIFQRARRP